ncbi:MAG: isoprenylcysteine carboxylmethyltransferase family protein [Candidatus Rokubacteria bacterium]|nr:isoprenylcysteine carboxylmethyltransferase family protein [Candidatus Rokubacteria bacterium]
MFRLADFLFRWRSYLPLALIPVVAGALMTTQHPLKSWLGDLAWEVGCVLFALAGWGIRAYTVGVAAPGTSGRNTRRQKAATLNTTGPYSVVRHPLYVANGIIALGLALFPHTWLAPVIVAVATIAYYACIGWREEAFLKERFGEAYEAWAARVPAALPAPSRYVPAARPFDWVVVARREFYALALILIAPLFLDAAEDLYETGRVTVDAVWVISAIVGAAAFLVLRYLKKRTTILTPAAARGDAPIPEIRERPQGSSRRE